MSGICGRDSRKVVHPASPDLNSPALAVPVDMKPGVAAMILETGDEGCPICCFDYQH